MHEHLRCNIELVATGQHGEVHVCRDYGAVHLHIGPFSLRLRLDIFRSICATLTASADCLHAGGTASEPLGAWLAAKH